jgi:hypothetical protein
VACTLLAVPQELPLDSRRVNYCGLWSESGMTNTLSSNSVPFWDGKIYSAAELNRAPPGLAAVALANPVLAEQWPMWRFKYANGVFAVAAGLALVFFVPSVAVWGTVAIRHGTSEMGLEPLVPLLFVAGLSLALGALLWVLALLHYPSYRPIVTVTDGVLSVQTSDGQISLSANLSDCCWYHGWVSDTVLSSGPAGLILWQRAIVIRFPRQSRFASRYHIAVGLTTEYNAIWEAALKLAGVPQIANKRSEPTTDKTE